MKNTIFIVLLLTSLTFIACNTDTKPKIVETATDTTKSKAYLEVVKYSGGDFSGFLLGEDFETASKVLDEKLLVEKDADYLFYKIEETYTNTEIQIIFEEKKLTEILLDAYVYDETGTFDKASSAVLFNEIKEDFLKRFGKKYMETSNEKNDILYWSNEKKNIQLIHEVDKASIHVYLDISEIEE